MDQELERAALVALLRRGDRPWSELTDQIEAVGSAREVLDSSLDGSGQGARFSTGPAVDLEGIVAEIADWEREGMRLVTILDEDYPLYLRLVHQRPPVLFLRGRAVEDDLRVPTTCVTSSMRSTSGGSTRWTQNGAGDAIAAYIAGATLEPSRKRRSLPSHPSVPGPSARRSRPEESSTGPSMTGAHVSMAATISASRYSKATTPTSPALYSCHSPTS
ncbi:hypothetical protein ACLMNJ_19525 [Streptomyces seoulensis]